MKQFRATKFTSLRGLDSTDEPAYSLCEGKCYKKFRQYVYFYGWKTNFYFRWVLFYCRFMFQYEIIKRVTVAAKQNFNFTNRCQISTYYTQKRC